MFHISFPYKDIQLDDILVCHDHMFGFEQDGSNRIFDQISNLADKTVIINYYQIVNDAVRKKYSKLDIRFDSYRHWFIHTKPLAGKTYNLNFAPTNFIMTLLGHHHYGRWLLCAALDKAGWLNLDYSRKNISFDIHRVDGYIQQMVPPDLEPFYFNKFVDLSRKDFYLQQQHDESFRIKAELVDHVQRVRDLSPLIEKTFLYLVSESLPTSYVPFITEKFLYGVSTGSLFLSYAQPHWHAKIRDMGGFKLYDDIFDYSFDAEPNFIVRLGMLMDMIKPFSKMSQREWLDIYDQTKEIREFNKQHFASNDYQKMMERYDTWKTLQIDLQ